MTSPKTNKNNPHLDFYLEHDISPVRQDVSDIHRHLERRGALYRRVGAPAIMIEGKRVIEVGPGSGHNSLYTASCLPASYDLLEPNPSGQRDIKALYETYKIPHTKPTLIPMRLEEFSTDEPYDIAITEAWIGTPEYEHVLLAKLAKMLRPGGILIMTFTSPIGMFVNTLRRILGNTLIANESSLDGQTNILLDAFGSHVDTLEDMSRYRIDWVQDNLINPAFLTACITPSKIIESIGEGFSVYECCPKFHEDWRWYKTLHSENMLFNEIFLKDYSEKCHVLMDVRVMQHNRRDAQVNLDLEKDCFALMMLVKEYEDAGTPLEQEAVLALTRRISANIADSAPMMVAAIQEFEDFFISGEFTSEMLSEMKATKHLFGRELSYISIIHDA